MSDASASRNKAPLITVLGAGSIGCYLGGRLLRGGARVRFIGRDRYAQILARTGLSLSQHDREVVNLGDVDFQTDVAALKGSDIVALCVKSQDTEEAAKAIKAHAPESWVISFQNGISNLPILKSILPDATISGAVVPFNVTSPEDGRFHQGTDGDLIIGPSAPDSVMEALKVAKVGVQYVEDIEAHLWAKLLVNLNNALNALSGGPLRDGLIQRGYRKVLIAMIREGLLVADAEGVKVATFNGRHPEKLLSILSKPDWLYKLIMDRIAKIDRTARSSMLDDLTLGRVSELDYLQGEIVFRAEKLGLSAPVNEAVMKETLSAFAVGKSPGMSGSSMARRFLN